MTKQKLNDGGENVRRCAIVVSGKKPFFDWLLQQDPMDQDLPEDLKEGEVYLIPDFEEKGQVERWLGKYFDEIFSEQLFGWYTDESCWPNNRTLGMFREWFDVSIHTMVWDMVDGVIEKD
jgi:hypothetical protein